MKLTLKKCNLCFPDWNHELTPHEYDIIAINGGYNAGLGTRFRASALCDLLNAKRNYISTFDNAFLQSLIGTIVIQFESEERKPTRLYVQSVTDLHGGAEE